MAVSAADDRNLKIWETATRLIIRSFAGYGPLAVSSDGRHIVSVSPRRYASLQVIEGKREAVATLSPLSQ